MRPIIEARRRAREAKLRAEREAAIKAARIAKEKEEKYQKELKEMKEESIKNIKKMMKDYKVNIYKNKIWEHTFTHCGCKGYNSKKFLKYSYKLRKSVYKCCIHDSAKGPTLDECMNEYKNVPSFKNIKDFKNVNGIQYFTVQETGIYLIDAYGAQGGNSLHAGGKGARIKGYHYLNEGDMIFMVVGMQPTWSNSGGGGTYISRVLKDEIIKELEKFIKPIYDAIKVSEGNIKRFKSRGYKDHAKSEERSLKELKDLLLVENKELKDLLLVKNIDKLPAKVVSAKTLNSKYHYKEYTKRYEKYLKCIKRLQNIEGKNKCMRTLPGCENYNSWAYKLRRWQRKRELVKEHLEYEGKLRYEKLRYEEEVTKMKDRYTLKLINLLLDKAKIIQIVGGGSGGNKFLPGKDGIATSDKITGYPAVDNQEQYGLLLEYLKNPLAEYHPISKKVSKKTRDITIDMYKNSGTGPIENTYGKAYVPGGFGNGGPGNHYLIFLKRYKHVRGYYYFNQKRYYGWHYDKNQPIYYRDYHRYNMGGSGGGYYSFGPNQCGGNSYTMSIFNKRVSGANKGHGKIVFTLVFSEKYKDNLVNKIDDIVNKEINTISKEDKKKNQKRNFINDLFEDNINNYYELLMKDDRRKEEPKNDNVVNQTADNNQPTTRQASQNNQQASQNNQQASQNNQKYSRNNQQASQNNQQVSQNNQQASKNNQQASQNNQQVSKNNKPISSQSDNSKQESTNNENKQINNIESNGFLYNNKIYIIITVIVLITIGIGIMLYFKFKK